jgi:tRNA A37 threonylcarbamoyladenosine dehydratase
MSNTLIDHSPDLKRLRDEGYEVETRGAFLLVHNVPYVNASREIKRGTLVSPLTLSTPTRAGKPGDHVIHFTGDQPCNWDGSVIQSLPHPNPGPKVLDEKNIISTKCSFSNRPKDDFPDYYEKVISYIGVICAPAFAIDPNVTPRTFKPIESTDPNYVFKYLDTNSSRAEIIAITAKLENQKLGIIGLGGTGSYVLDFVAKTPVLEIHLFDGDDYFVHNAFRTPGATSIDKFGPNLKKVSYLASIYSNLHKYIIPHAEFLTSENLSLLPVFSFVFVCIDDGPAKKALIDYLIAIGTPFVDCGIGVEAKDNCLGGLVRVTTGTASKHDHIQQRISFKELGNDDYAQNIQIAELNALNAALAVIKWKKQLGFYHDQEHEHNTLYDLNVNKLMNDETVA